MRNLNVENLVIWDIWADLEPYKILYKNPVASQWLNGAIWGSDGFDLTNGGVRAVSTNESLGKVANDQSSVLKP